MHWYSGVDGGISGYLKKWGLVGLFWRVGSGEESGPRQGPEREGVEWEEWVEVVGHRVLCGKGVLRGGVA